MSPTTTRTRALPPSVFPCSMCTAYIGSSPGGDFDDHKYNGDKDDEDDISFLISTAYARSSSIDFLVFDMNQKQIAILWIREVVQKWIRRLGKCLNFFRFSLDSFPKFTCFNLNPWESGSIYLFPNSHVICNRWHPVGEWLKVVGCVRTGGRNLVWQKTSFKGELRLPRTWSRNLMLKVWLWDDDLFFPE